MEGVKGVRRKWKGSEKVITMYMYLREQIWNCIYEILFKMPIVEKFST